MGHTQIFFKPRQKAVIICKLYVNVFLSTSAKTFAYAIFCWYLYPNHRRFIPFLTKDSNHKYPISRWLIHSLISTICEWTWDTGKRYFLCIKNWTDCKTLNKMLELLLSHWRPPSPPLTQPWARICKPFKEPKNWFPTWWAGTKPYLLYRLARLHRLADSITRNRFLDSLNIWKIQKQQPKSSLYFG